METKSHIFKNSEKTQQMSRNKVTIVGSGAVGTAVAFSILAQGISDDVVIVGRNEEVVKGEILDLQHGAHFLGNAKIQGGDDVKYSSGSKLIIFAAGSRRGKAENRMDLVKKNIEVLKALVPALVQLSPDCILIIVTNPVDVLTQVAWKISGLPQHRVFGSGTHLDTSRLHLIIAQKLGITPNLINGWVIGEHGDFSVPVWSSVSIAGNRLVDINPRVATENDRENWIDCHEKVVKAAAEVISLKGYTSWAIALSCTDIAAAVIKGNNEVKAVSTLVKGFYGIKKEVFMSLPCVLDSNGISSVVNIHLSGDEKNKFIESANFIDEVLKTFSY